MNSKLLLYLLVVGTMLLLVQEASANCSAKQVFVEARAGTKSVTLKSTHVLYRPYKYSLPETKIIFFPSKGANVSVCDAKTYPQGFVKEAYGKLVVVQMGEKRCEVPNWTLQLQSVGAKGVLLWNTAGTDVVYQAGSAVAMDDKLLTIPTRMISNSAGKLLQEATSRVNSDGAIVTTVELGCHAYSHPENVCVSDKASGEMWQVDGTYAREAKAVMNDHPVWRKRGYSSLMNDRFVWLHAHKANGWWWIISKQVVSFDASTFPNVLQDGVGNGIDAFCKASELETADPTACKNWSIFNHVEKKWTRDVNGTVLHLAKGVCVAGETSVCVSKSSSIGNGEKEEKELAEVFGSFEQVHEKQAYWMRSVKQDVAEHSVSKKMSFLTWSEFVLQGRKWFGWKLVALPRGKVVAYCPHVQAGLYGWREGVKGGEEIMLKPFLCVRWFTADVVELQQLDVDENKCSKQWKRDEKARKEVKFEEKVCLTDKNGGYHLLQRMFGVWAKNGLEYNKKPMYVLDNRKTGGNKFYYMVYNDKADTWIVVEKLPKQGEVVEVVLECETRGAVKPEMCKDGWRYGTYRFGDVETMEFVTDEALKRGCFDGARMGKELKGVEERRSFCVHFPFKQLPEKIKWRRSGGFDAEDASGLYVAQKGGYTEDERREMSLNGVKYKYLRRGTQGRRYEIVYDGQMRVWRVNVEGKAEREVEKVAAYCVETDAASPYDCKKWYSHQLDEHGFVYDLSKAMRYNQCKQEVCVDTEKRHVTTPIQYLYGKWELHDKLKTSKPVYINERLHKMGMYPLYMLYVANKWHIAHETDLRTKSARQIAEEGHYIGRCEQEGGENPFECPRGKWTVMGHAEKEGHFVVKEDTKGCYQSVRVNFPVRNQTVTRRVCAVVRGKHHHYELSGVFHVVYHKFNGRHFWYRDVCPTAGKHHHHHHHLHHKHHSHHHHHKHKHHHHNHHHHHHHHHHKHHGHKRRLQEAHKHHHHHHHDQKVPPPRKGCTRYYLYYNEVRRFWLLDNKMTQNFVHPHVYCPDTESFSPQTCKKWYGIHDEVLAMHTSRVHTDEECAHKIKEYEERHPSKTQRKKDTAAIEQLEKMDEWFVGAIVVVTSVACLLMLGCCFAKKCKGKKCSRCVCRRPCKRANRLPKPKKKGYVMTDNEENDSEEQSKVELDFIAGNAVQQDDDLMAADENTPISPTPVEQKESTQAV